MAARVRFSNVDFLVADLKRPAPLNAVYLAAPVRDTNTGFDLARRVRLGAGVDDFHADGPQVFVGGSGRGQSLADAAQYVEKVAALVGA